MSFLFQRKLRKKQPTKLYVCVDILFSRRLSLQKQWKKRTKYKYLFCFFSTKSECLIWCKVDFGCVFFSCCDAIWSVCNRQRDSCKLASWRATKKRKLPPKFNYGKLLWWNILIHIFETSYQNWSIAIDMNNLPEEKEKKHCFCHHFRVASNVWVHHC